MRNLNGVDFRTDDSNTGVKISDAGFNSNNNTFEAQFDKGGIATGNNVLAEFKSDPMAFGLGEEFDNIDPNLKRMEEN